MRVTCIYKIVSTIRPDRYYIGSAVNFIGRKACHVSGLKKGNHHSKTMQRHVRKYGIEDLQFEILQQVFDKSKLLEVEQQHIDLFKPYFNSTPTAGSNLGIKFGPMSAEHKEKIRKGNLGKTVSEVNKRSRFVKIHKYTIDGEFVKTYESQTEALKAEGIGARRTDDNNLTIGGFVWVSDNMEMPDFKSVKERLISSKKVLCKPVLQLDKSGNVIAEFEGVRIAYSKTGIDHRSISQVATGSKIRKSAGGYLWKFKTEAA